MSDLNQFPNTSALRRILPTLTGYIVTKFEPATKYREEEEVMDEGGALAVVNGVDKTYTYDIEMMVKPSSSVPAPLTTLTFTAPTATNAIAIPGAGATFTVLIRGEVKHIGDAGKVAKIGFKGEINANIPTQPS